MSAPSTPAPPTAPTADEGEHRPADSARPDDEDEDNGTIAVAPCAAMSTESLFAAVAAWGDRTSSFVSSYAHFRDHALPVGRIRCVDTPGAVVAAGEPLCPADRRADAFFDLARAARATGRQAVMMPVGWALADELRRRGARTLCVGTEPVLELAEWLGEGGGPDPLDRLPMARALGRRGARLERWDTRQLDAERRAIVANLADRWRSSREGPLVAFLNVVDPLQHIEHKALFVAWDGKLAAPAAVLVATPVASGDGDGRVVAWFFCDYLRHPDARAGVVEWLFVEAARALRAEGASEIRLGLTPLLHLQRGVVDGVTERLLRPWLARHQARATFPFRYASVAAFKTKLGPTRWDPLYVVTDGTRGPTLARALAFAHFPDGPLAARTARWRTRLAARVRPEVLPVLRPAPRDLGEAVRGGAGVLGAAALFASLHIARTVHPAVQAFFERSRFVPSTWTPQGVWIGPLFHNHTYHLSGDLLSLLFFGLLLEWSTGHGLIAVVAAFGLWATNPLSTWIVTPLLTRFRPEDLPRFLTEGDVGSSNAVYAIVGAMAAGLKNPALLLLPFAANGVYLCFAKSSWLSVHHLIGLAFGFMAGIVWRRRRAAVA
jgi:hypothetical protein